MYELIIFLGICTSCIIASKLPEHAKTPAQACGKMLGCYYLMNYQDDDPGPGLLIEDIDVSLCSHLYYNFALTSADASVESSDPNEDIKSKGFQKFNNLRKKNPNLITMATMTGFGDQSSNKTINRIFTDEKLREKLVNNIVKYVKNYGFQGMDIEYADLPESGGSPSDKKNFVLLLKALRERFDKERLILSVSVNPNEAVAKILYNIKGISKYVEFINLMTFDFHGTSKADKKVGVGHNTPMYHSEKENSEERKKNIDYVVRYWIGKGAPPNKLILGTSSSGLSYTLADPKQFHRGAPFTKEGKYGSPVGYAKFCNVIEKWKYFYDPEQKVPYIHQRNQIIAYDDVHSIKTKAEYVNSMHLGGAMVDIMNNDDHDGKCGKKFALHKALHRVLRNKC